MTGSPFLIVTRQMPASSRKLAAAIAARLAQVVPPPLDVRAKGGRVTISIAGKSLGGSAAAAIVEDEDGRTSEERIVTAIRAILDGVQDAVTRELREPWPNKGGTTALPNARSDGRRVHLWFGDEQSPSLGLPPIEIAEVEHGG